MPDFTKHGELTAEGQRVADYMDGVLAEAGDNIDAINALPGHVKSWYVHVRKMHTATPGGWMESNGYAAGAVHQYLIEQDAAAAAAKAEKQQRESIDNTTAETIKSLTDQVKALNARLAKVEGTDATPDPDPEPDEDDEADEADADEGENEADAEEAVKPKKGK